MNSDDNQKSIIQPSFLQLDMTTFYDADNVLTKEGGLPPLHSTPTSNLEALTLIMVGAIFFDNILVPLPSVLDDNERNAFGEDASDLAKILMDAEIVKITKVSDPGTKKKTREYLENHDKHVRKFSFDYLTNLKSREIDYFKSWAELQLDNCKIMNNTAKELESELHKKWTEPLRDAVLTDLQQSQANIISKCKKNECEHIIQTLLRGFIYEVSAFKLKSWYLPHILRNGILQHIAVPRVRASVVHSLIESPVSKDQIEKTIKHNQAREWKMPFTVSHIFHAFINKEDYTQEALSSLLQNERKKTENMEARRLIREAYCSQGKDEGESLYNTLKVILEDLDIYKGKELPKLFRLVPRVIDVLTAGKINSNKIETVLLNEFKLGSNNPLLKILRTPLYLRGYKRYFFQSVK